MPVQLMLKTQRFEARAAQTIKVFAFYKNTFLMRQQNFAALALRNIAHLTFEGPAASWAFFGLVLRHVL
jgi:hypothetical protein